MMEKNHRIKSIDIEKLFDQVKLVLMKKNAEEIGIEENTFNLMSVYNKPTTDFKLHGQ